MSESNKGNEFICIDCGKDFELNKGDYIECPYCSSVSITQVPIEEELKSLETPKDKKYDQGKPDVHQMKKDFAKALLSVAEVTSYGIKKYKAPGSWKEVEDGFRRYDAAFGRHDFQSTFEDIDEESKLLHLSHRAWNALATLQLFLEKEERKKKGEEQVYEKNGKRYMLFHTGDNPTCTGCELHTKRKDRVTCDAPCSGLHVSGNHVYKEI